MASRGHALPMAGALRRVAGVGVRFDGLHHLRAGPGTGAARPPARARRRTRLRRGHRLVWRDHFLDFSDRLGHRRRPVRPAGGQFRTDPGAGFHHPDLRRVHRPGRPVANLVATGFVPFPHRAGHRRRMGGGRDAGGGSVAGGQAHQGGGNFAIGVGRGIFRGGAPQPAPAQLQLAARSSRSEWCRHWSHSSSACGSGNRNDGSRPGPRNGRPALRGR